MVHVGRHVCLWCAVARNLPKVFPVWTGAALAEEVPEGKWPLWLLCAYRCDSVASSFEAGGAGATLVGSLLVNVVVVVVFTAETDLAVVVNRFCPVRRRPLIIHRY